MAVFPTKAEYVYGELRGHIAQGRFAPGEYLRLKPLAEAFHTSEVPVRDALRMLQRDGLVEMRGKGTSVATIDWVEMREAISIRTHLEVLAIEEAVPHHDAASVARVTALLERMDRHMAAGEASAFSRTARAFHAALYGPCPSAAVKRAIEDLWVRLWHAGSRPLFQGLPDQQAIAQREHRAIVDAVRDGDVAAAVAAMRAHRVTTLSAWMHVRALRDQDVAGERPETKTDAAYRALRTRIREGDFVPGEPLRLRALALALGMSETPVHEALLMLQRDGLVEPQPRRGVVAVAAPGAEETRQAVALRMHLELLALETAVPRHDARSLAAVAAALDRLDAADDLAAADRALHAALNAPAGMPLLARMIDVQWDRAWQAGPPADRALAQREHRAIAAAVAARDAAAAVAALAAHRATALSGGPTSG
jgi:DNA-binding GntR family transcriptional regulator